MVHFHLSLSGYGTGSLETCTHIILRPKTYSLFISIAETYYYYYYLPVTLGKYCKGLQTAHLHKPQHILAGSYVQMKGTITMEMFSLVSYIFGFFCDRIGIAHPHKILAHFPCW